jgi:predicted protein tyrosine phosphatase
MVSTFSLLTVCGLEELEQHSTRGVSHVLSIIDPDLPDPVVFDRYDRHHRMTLRFHDAIEPGPDVVLPQPPDVDAILDFGRGLTAPDGGDGHLLIHCHMGISRSTAAMMMLLAQAHPELGEDEIIARITAIRPIAWPNSRMIGFADTALDLDGRLTRAAIRIYARSLEARPDLAEPMTRSNRGREVELGRRLLQ